MNKRKSKKGKLVLLLLLILIAAGGITVWYLEKNENGEAEAGACRIKMVIEGWKG